MNSAPKSKRTQEARSGAVLRQPKFSQELDELAAHFAKRPVCLGEIIEATRGRGFNLILIFISLPFITPMPLPGLSIPFGLTVAVIGFRLALGQKPWLPQKLLSRRLPSGFLARLLAAASRVIKFLELFLRSRMVFLHDQIIYRRFAGALIALSGLLLVLPLPVPFSNGLPACTVLLLSASALARDGVVFMVGCALFLLSALFFALLAIGGAESLEHLRQFMTGG